MYRGPVFDADNHVVETAENMSRRIEEPYRTTHLIESREENGVCPWFVGGEKCVIREQSNKPGGLIPRPGSIKEFIKWMAGENPDYRYVPVGVDIKTPEGRVARMDQMGVEASIIFPSEFLAIWPTVEETGARLALGHAFNRWFAEDWGFDYKDRLYTAPFLMLDDLDLAVKEAEFLIRNGARVVTMPVGPIDRKSPADPYFDPVWSRLNEAGVTVAFHLGESTGTQDFMRAWGEKPTSNRLKASAFYLMHGYGEAPIMHMISSLIFYNLFERFPRLHLLSVENGCGWVASFLKHMDKSRALARAGYWPCGPLKAKPSQIFARHVRVVPFPEEDVRGLVQQVGADFLCMGTDYPHPEGVLTPTEFYDLALAELPAEDVEKIMYRNARDIIPARATAVA
ncbi:MAG: amidohydrolase family protein [Caulobacteraceae bacterium]|nr:amidohydrolase family protein [Caulobacteraceae bacterium]